MPNDLSKFFMRSRVSAPSEKNFPFGKRREAQGQKNKLLGGTEFANSLEVFEFQNCRRRLPRQNSSPSQVTSNQKGFVTVWALAFLPCLFVMGLGLLLTQYLTTNWKQSVHICRTELLVTQETAARHLKTLLHLNPAALALRISMKQAQIQYASAVATANPTLAAVFLLRIASIHRKQKALDKMQKVIIARANSEMSSGLLAVQTKIREQNRRNQGRLPDSFSFDVITYPLNFKSLAVKPDLPDIAPLYELRQNFEAEQNLSVSWRSSFAVQSKMEKPWFQNRNRKKDSCSVTLKSVQNRFESVLVEDKHLSKL